MILTTILRFIGNRLLMTPLVLVLDSLKLDSPDYLELLKMLDQHQEVDY